MKRAASLALSVLALGLAPSASVASTHPPIPFEEVLRRADVGFHGVVTATREVAPEGIEMAFTVVTFAVREVAFDRTGGVGDTIELTFAGGRRGDRHVAVAGVPRFAVGDEAVLFVRHDSLRYADPVIGGPQGRFIVTRDEETGRATVLTAGRRGLTLPADGGTEPVATAARVERIAGGRPVFAAPAPRAAAPLPDSLTVGAEVRRASEAPATAEAALPDRIADVAAFLAHARKIADRR